MKKTIVALLVSLFAVGAFAAGAIAVDDEAGSNDAGWGIAYGEDRDEAGREAMKQCRKAGNKGCKVAVRFDKCGAYAASKEYFGIGWGNSESAAKQKALGECSGKCKIVVSGCDD